MNIRMRTAATALALSLAVTVAACGGDDSDAASGDAGKSFTIGLQSPESLDIVPVRLALDELTADGYSIEIAFFDSPDTLGQAMQSGDIDMGVVNAGTIFRSIDAGLDAKIFMALSATGYQMMARKELTSCASLDGKVLGIESRESTTGSLAARWLKSSCPDAKPKLTVVPGSENRIAGMLAGQIDASPIDYQNSTVLLNQASDRFGVIEAFSDARELAAAVYATTDWLAANKELVSSFVDAYITKIQEGYKDVNALAPKAAEVVPDLDPEVRKQVLDLWVETHQWNPVSGVQPAYIERAIDLYGTATGYKNIKTADQVSTTEFVAGQPADL